jgi:hypothetical protein
VSGRVIDRFWTAIAVAVMLACAAVGVYAATERGDWLLAVATAALLIGGTVQWMRLRRYSESRPAIDEMFGWLLFVTILHAWTLLP